MSAHTPGPWTISTDPGAVEDSRGECIATVSTAGVPPGSGRDADSIRAANIATAGANARLIAAAPDLYAIALDLRDDWREFDTGEPVSGSDLVDYMGGLRLRLLMTLAKAEA